MKKQPLLVGSLLLGIGLGGFFDGIVFHQILQWHSLLSARLPQDNLVNVKTSMIWDGIFHAFTWSVTSAGIYFLWRAANGLGSPLSGRRLLGGMFFGWGLFNLTEGLIDHHLLGIHHVYESWGLSWADYAFLLSGGLGIGIGWWLLRISTKRAVGN